MVGISRECRRGVVLDSFLSPRKDLTSFPCIDSNFLRFVDVMLKGFTSTSQKGSDPNREQFGTHPGIKATIMKTSALETIVGLLC
jgi:hypothetical protein